MQVALLDKHAMQTIRTFRSITLFVFLCVRACYDTSFRPSKGLVITDIMEVLVYFTMLYFTIMLFSKVRSLILSHRPAHLTLPPSKTQRSIRAPKPKTITQRHLHISILSSPFLPLPARPKRHIIDPIVPLTLLSSPSPSPPNSTKLTFLGTIPRFHRQHRKNRLHTPRPTK